MEHSHIKVHQKEDQCLYIFCTNLRQAKRAVILVNGTSYKLTEDQIAVLQAIGFNWEYRARATYTPAFNDDCLLA